MKLQENDNKIEMFHVTVIKTFRQTSTKQARAGYWEHSYFFMHYWRGIRDVHQSYLLSEPISAKICTIDYVDEVTQKGKGRRRRPSDCVPHMGEI